ncbi:MAG: flagellar filament capping protein FliD [Gammaproteobacteria bacterium]|nr:flagellar filament capping protein FliD [Gammaproteobacteria bacterium]
MTDINTNNVGTKITQALKTGSGVDIYDLATTLAEAESLPKINIITAKKEESTSSLSGYGVLKASVASLKTSFDALKDRDTLLSKSVEADREDRARVKMISQTAAKAGTYAIKVISMARPQLNELKDNSSSFTSLDQSLAGSNFTITIKVPRDAASGTDVVVSTHTPQGIIDAVNSITSTTGVTARAFNPASTGTTFSIFLEGKTGADNTFDFASTLTGSSALTGGAWGDKERNAQDLRLTLNEREDIYRQTNSPTDVIDGVQTTFVRDGSDTTINIVVSEDTSALETSINSMIDSYNDFVNVSDYLIGDTDEEDELAGSLSGDKNTVNLIRSRMRSAINMTSSTASNGYSTLRNIGIGSKLSGELTLNKTTYSAAVKSNFSDIRTMLTADTNDQVASDVRDKGLAMDVGIIIDAMVSDTGTLKVKETNATENISRYEEELLDLQDQLENIKARYLRQFAAMESIVQRSKNTGEYLTNQFKAMQNMND